MPGQSQNVKTRISTKGAFTLHKHSPGGSILKPTLKLTREERYDLPLAQQCFTESTFSLPEDAPETFVTSTSQFPPYMLSRLDRHSNAQLVRRRMKYYEIAEYRYNGNSTPIGGSAIVTESKSDDSRFGKLSVQTDHDGNMSSAASSQLSSQRGRRRSSAQVTPSSDRVLRPRPSKQLGSVPQRLVYQENNSYLGPSDVSTEEIEDQTIQESSVSLLTPTRQTSVMPIGNGDGSVYRRVSASSTTRVSEPAVDYSRGISSPGITARQQSVDMMASGTWSQRIADLWKHMTNTNRHQPFTSRASASRSQPRTWLVPSVLGLDNSSHEHSTRRSVSRSSAEPFVNQTRVLRSSTSQCVGVGTGTTSVASNDGDSSFCAYLVRQQRRLLVNFFAFIYMAFICAWRLVSAAIRGTVSCVCNLVNLKSSKSVPIDNAADSQYYRYNRKMAHSTNSGDSYRMATTSKPTNCSSIRPCWCLSLCIPLLLLLLVLACALFRPADVSVTNEDRVWFGFLPSDAQCRRRLLWLSEDSSASPIQFRWHCLIDFARETKSSLFLGLANIFRIQKSSEHSSVFPSMDSSSSAVNPLSIDLDRLTIDVGRKLSEIVERLRQLDQRTESVATLAESLRTSNHSHSLYTEALKQANEDLHAAFVEIQARLAALPNVESAVPEKEALIGELLDRLAKQTTIVSTTTLEAKLIEIRQEIAAVAASSTDVNSMLGSEFNEKLKRFADIVAELRSLVSGQRADLDAKLATVQAEFETYKLSLQTALSRSAEFLASDQTAIREELKFSDKKLEQGLSLLKTQIDLISTKIADFETLNGNLNLAVQKLSSELNSREEENSVTMAKTELLTAKQIEATLEVFKSSFSKQLSENLRQRFFSDLDGGKDSEITDKLFPLIKRVVSDEIKQTFKGATPSMSLGLVSHIREMIDAALKTFAADRINLADYALESAGASVVSTRCTRAYTDGSTAFRFFGIPLAYISKSPNTILQPGNQPGDCWAFHGAEGQMIIKLSMPVHVTGVSLEHLPASLSPYGTVDSAPKDFVIKALKSEFSDDGETVGSFTYQQGGPTIQYFAIQRKHIEPVSFVEFAISTNHGNPVYTCVYRLRVHGVLPQFKSESPASNEP